jgi:hypothetical protein
MEAVCKKLPFDVIGGTVLSNENSKEIGEMMLSVMVLTSDDVKFSCALSGEINHDEPGSIDGEIAGAYGKAASVFEGKPSLLFMFAPLFFHIAGDFIVEAFDKATGGVPLFGTISSDNTAQYEKVRAIYNGKSYDKRIAVAAFYGNVSPKFYITSLSNDKILKNKAVITKSKDNVLIEVNGIAAGEYMRSLGLSTDNLNNYNAIHFMVTFKNGAEPTARGIFQFTRDSEYVCGGVMPEGADLRIGTISHDEVISTTTELLNRISKDEKYGGMLMFSCIARNMILGMDLDAEMTIVKKMLETIPHSCNYSNGEICPVYDKNGNLQNRFHNYTFVACQF